MTAAARSTMTLADAHLAGLDLVRHHTRRFGSYVTSLDEPALRAGVPGGDWTVAQTIAHLRAVYLRYTTDTRRADSPAGVGRQNAADDLTLTRADVAAAAATMAEQLEFLAGVVPHIPPDRRFPFHAGQQITMAGGWGNLIGELLAHGDDIARATSTTFAIPSADTEILWRFTAPVLQGWLRPEAAAGTDTWELRFPFGPITVRFDAGSLLWDAPRHDHPDEVVEIEDAASFALAFPYGRRTTKDARVRELAGRFARL